MYEDFIHWFETDPRAEEYRHLRWDRELEEARRKEAEAAIEFRAQSQCPLPGLFLSPRARMRKAERILCI